MTYDLNVQHFQGSGDENGNGRIHILLDPEVINSKGDKKGEKKKVELEDPDSSTPAVEGESPEKDGN